MTGRYIRPISALMDEEEVFFLPGTSFLLDPLIETDKAGNQIVSMEEIILPFFGDHKRLKLKTDFSKN